MTDFKALAQKLADAHRVWAGQEIVFASRIAWGMVHEVMDALEAEDEWRRKLLERLKSEEPIEDIIEDLSG